MPASAPRATVARASLGRADEAFQPVMNHDQLEHGIVVVAAGIGPAVLRCQVEGHCPGERHDGKRCSACHHPGKPPAPIERAGEQPARRQRRAADQGGQHLDVEGEAQQRHRRHQGKAAPAQGRRRRQQQEEDQPGIGVVGAVDRDDHRASRPAAGRRRCRLPRRTAGAPADRAGPPRRCRPAPAADGSSSRCSPAPRQRPSGSRRRAAACRAR